MARNTDSTGGSGGSRNVTQTWDQLCEDDFAEMDPEAAAVMREAEKKQTGEKLPPESKRKGGFDSD